MNERKPSSSGKPAHRGPAPGGAKKKTARRPKGGVNVRRIPNQPGWELVPPRGAVERADDLLQVHDMIAHGEIEIAMDELRWLLGGCPEFIEAHAVLGELALAENDLALARAHFGLAFQVGQQAIEQRTLAVPLPYARPANQAFFSCGKGLVWCLLKQQKRHMAQAVVNQLLECDPSDPLKVADLLAQPPV